jgi:predicted N-acetyltransferase YhbS
MAESTGQTWRLERYRPGDEAGVLDLFRTVFGKARSLEHWNWQFRDNPYGGPFVSLARRESDGLVVGSYSVMPVMLNLMGKQVLMCQSVDTAVHPDFRGQRIFEKTATDCYAWCESQGVKAVMGFPNASSYPGFVRSLAWKRIVFPTYHQLRLSVAGPMKKILPVPLLPSVLDAVFKMFRRVRLDGRRGMLQRLLGKTVHFQVGESVPEAYDALWNIWRSQEVLSVWKDAAYFRWRYDRNPDYRFRYYYLARGDEVLALAVGGEIDGGLALCEFVVRSRDVTLGRFLMAEICLAALAVGMKGVSFLAHDAGYFEDVLEGFSHQKSYTNVFGGRSFESGVLAELLPHADNWTVTFGDGDFV